MTEKELDPRAAAIIELLALPDPGDLIGRGYRDTELGDPDRQAALKPIISAAYVQHFRQDRRDESAVVTVWRRRKHARR